MSATSFNFNDRITEAIYYRNPTNGTMTRYADRELIDNIFAQHTGGIYTAATRAMYGLGFGTNTQATPPSLDHTGYTFFTKPRMCLNASNCLRDRSLSYLLNDDPLTIPRAVRALLDPIGHGNPYLSKYGPKKGTHWACPLVDPLNPFITLLSNTLVSLSGFVDVDVSTYTSQKGPMGESWSMYDGVAKYYGDVSLSSNFNNIQGDPIGLLLHSWITYGSRVGWDETMIPWMDSIIDHEKDYETRIYRFVMDPTKTYIQRMACTGAVFPTNTNTGAGFDYNAQQPMTDATSSQSISWKGSGMRYYDPMIAVDFNLTVIQFNPSMGEKYRAGRFTKIEPQFRSFFRNEGYPWIDLHTGELEWYVRNERFAERMKVYNALR